MEKSVTNYTNISEEFNSFFAEIGKTVSESVLSPAASFYSYIKDRSALYLFMNQLIQTRLTSVVKNLKTNAL